MTQKRVCVSWNETVVGTVNRLTLQTGKTFSELIEGFAIRELAKNYELTPMERRYYQELIITKKLDDMLKMLGIMKVENMNLVSKFQTSLYMGFGKSRLKQVKNDENSMELSLFEILNNIKEFDKLMYKSLCADLGYFGRMKKRYLKQYPTV